MHHEVGQLKEQRGWLQCTKCKLHEGRRKVVLGRGNRDASIMFIGEGPGSEEDRSGKPFVGRAGDVLDTFFNLFDISREEVFIDNVVACWPYVYDGERAVSRKPGADEVASCRMRVQQSIYLVDPMVIVALGDSALQALTSTSGIMKAAGEVFETKVPGWYTDVAYPVYAMFHPAYLARQPPLDEKKPNERHPITVTYRHFKDMLDTSQMLREAYYGIMAL